METRVPGNDGPALTPVGFGPGALRGLLGQLAVACVLRTPPLAFAIVGARTVTQVDENVRAAGWSLEHDELVEIERIYHEYD
jgi:aryl-alcohol dehydrogenase-like predicted oxidoreductase